jgi:capsular exopolysaccharide synthesis family protein
VAKETRRPIFDYYHPESVVATEFRRLLHNITRPVDGIERKSFLVTSAMLSEGKSTVAAYLAITAAAYKKRKTILIDCDLRRPTVHKLFNLPIENGITDLIDGSIKVEDAFRSTSLKNLWVVTAGTLKDNPTELFEGDSVKHAIEQIKFYFDVVFVDCAPVIPVSDPVVLAPELDALLLVVKAGSTQKDVIKRACDIIGRSDTTIAGVVLNNVEGVLPYHYNHRYYGYHYSVKKR